MSVEMANAQQTPKPNTIPSPIRFSFIFSLVLMGILPINLCKILYMILCHYMNLTEEENQFAGNDITAHAGIFLSPLSEMPVGREVQICLKVPGSASGGHRVSN